MGERCDALPLCGERARYVRTLIPQAGWRGGAPRRKNPHSSMFSADRGILTQLEWKYMQGKGFSESNPLGEGELNSLTFISPNDVSPRSESLSRELTGRAGGARGSFTTRIKMV